MDKRYPAANKTVQDHRDKLHYDTHFLDVGPQSQKFLQSVVPNVP